MTLEENVFSKIPGRISKNFPPKVGWYFELIPGHERQATSTTLEVVCLAGYSTETTERPSLSPLMVGRVQLDLVLYLKVCFFSEVEGRQLHSRIFRSSAENCIRYSYTVADQSMEVPSMYMFLFLNLEGAIDKPTKLRDTWQFHTKFGISISQYLTMDDEILDKNILHNRF